MTIPEKKSSNIRLTGFLLLAVCFLTACGKQSQTATEKPPIDEITSVPIRRLLESAHKQTSVTTEYTQNYFALDYPNGDPPTETGACTDVVIRAFRNAGIDLQKDVHEDMAENFPAYPKKWGLSKTDTNIDHRRVPNLQKFFDRKGKTIPITLNGEDYSPGDVVSWDLNGKGLTHIGLVSNYWNPSTKRYSIIHNIGGGAQEEDRLFEWKITGHYRYF